MNMKILIENVASLLLFGLIGWILGKKRLLTTVNIKLLSVLIVWLFLPCNFFLSFSRNFTVAYLTEKYPVILTSVVVILVLISLNSLIIPRLVKETYRQNLLKYSLTAPNYGYVGLPLIQSVYGDLMLFNAQVFALPISVFTSTEGYRMLTNSGKTSWKKLFSPMIVAIMLGCIVGLTGLRLPSVLTNVVSKSSDCMGPVSMLMAGITISDYPLGSILRDKQAYVVALFRLLVIPLSLCLILSRFFPMDVVRIAVLLYAMPCGLNVIVYPKMIGEDCKPGAAMALISTVSCLVTIPFCMQVLEWIC